MPPAVLHPLRKPGCDVSMQDQDHELPDQSQDQEENDPSQSVEISDRDVIIHSNLGQHWTHCSQKCCGQSQHNCKDGPPGIGYEKLVEPPSKIGINGKRGISLTQGLM